MRMQLCGIKTRAFFSWQMVISKRGLWDRNEKGRKRGRIFSSDMNYIQFLFINFALTKIIFLISTWHIQKFHGIKIDVSMMSGCNICLNYLILFILILLYEFIGSIQRYELDMIKLNSLIIRLFQDFFVVIEMETMAMSS